MAVPELLAPAGNLEKLKIAVLYGADAIYCAGQQFSLRGGADNFSKVELKEGVAFAHLHGAKVYVVLNAFLHDHDLEDLPSYAQFLEECGTDAVIISDLGVMEVVKEFTKLPIHLSTQASCLNQYAARLWKNLGVRRIVLGREVPLEQAGWIKQQTGIEVELFVHGAMCMAYSGNCTISNYTAGRDSNRGGCIQSCRFQYSFQSSAQAHQAPVTTSFMSSKDLKGIEAVPHFFHYGIDSLKIEGRMKSNLYVAHTVQAYSRAIQLYQTTDPDTLQDTLHSLSKELDKLPHRGYTEASLQSPADESSIYYGNRNGSIRYELAGTVVEVCPNEYITLLVQNPFENDCILEVLNFAGETILLSTQGMCDLNHNPIQKAQPNSLILLPFVRQIDALNLARKEAA